MSEQMRSEFEAWMKPIDFREHTTIQLMEMAWQASRAALCVELPKIVFDDDMNKSEWVAIKSTLVECREAIHAAGVKAK